MRERARARPHQSVDLANDGPARNAQSSANPERVTLAEIVFGAERVRRFQNEALTELQIHSEIDCETEVRKRFFLVLIDFGIFPMAIDLSLVRSATGAVSMLILVYGLVWEAGS